MIEKLKIIEDDEIDMSIGAVNTRFEDTELVRKINELVDAVNELQSRSENVQKPISLLDIYNEIGEMYSVLWNKIEDIMCELVHLQEEINPAETDTESGQVDVLKWVQGKDYKPKVKENHKIRSTNERLREALSLAENALIRLANDACDMDEHIYIDGILNQIERITKGGKDE